MSEEKPKSIWKKSWKGWGGLLLWMASLTVAVFLIVVVMELLIPGRTQFSKVTHAATKVSLLVGVIGVLVVAFFRWLCCWRNFKRFLFGFACFATLIALFYAEEDFRGKHDWNKFKREQEAKGERFDWQSIVPPAVPDDENFAMQPIWVDSMKFEYGTNIAKQWYGETMTEAKRTNLVDRLQMGITDGSDLNISPTNINWGSWVNGTMTVLSGWQNYYRRLATTTNLFPVAQQPQTPAQDVLLALSKYDSAIEELRKASKLPYSRFPLGYDGMPAAILLPHLAALKRSSQVLQLRAIAELQNGESEKALADVKLMLRLTDASRTEAILISHLVRIVILQFALQPIYEGLANHQWTDAQLAELNSELSNLDFLADYQFIMRGERNWQIANIEFLRHPDLHNLQWKHPRFYFLMPSFFIIKMLSNLSGVGEEIPSRQIMALGFGPSGWIDQNELRIARFETKWYLPIVDEGAKTISPKKARAADKALGKETRHRTPENVLETLFMPSLGSISTKFAYAQSATDLARVAIALERYRLADGNYPDSIDALAGQFPERMPHDIINGESLNYHRTSDGQFVLYSVGWNERDDGGIVGRTTKSWGVDNRRGDWVWRYPQKE